MSTSKGIIFFINLSFIYLQTLLCKPVSFHMLYLSVRD
ncbi:hypothetical protein [Staphylococcus phage vB_SauM-V1SA20]|nr:hypothetical protein [Staphylococcus phage vB_SauM-V1SA20]